MSNQESLREKTEEWLTENRKGYFEQYPDAEEEDYWRVFFGALSRELEEREMAFIKKDLCCLSGQRLSDLKTHAYEHFCAICIPPERPKLGLIKGGRE